MRAGLVWGRDVVASAQGIPLRQDQDGAVWDREWVTGMNTEGMESGERRSESDSDERWRQQHRGRAKPSHGQATQFALRFRIGPDTLALSLKRVRVMAIARQFTTVSGPKLLTVAKEIDDGGVM